LHAGDGLVRGDKIIQTLNKLTKNKRLEDLDIPLRVVATDFWKRAEVVISQGDVGEAVRASISIPGIFEPVLRDARVMIDGGIINSLPYEVIRQECDVLVAVDVTGDSVPGENQSAKPKILESIFIAFQMMEAAQVKSKLLQSRPDIYIHPALSNIDILDFRQMDGILESVKPEAEQFRALLQSRFRQAIQELVRAPKSVLEA
jgi:NTE family protein